MVCNLDSVIMFISYLRHPLDCGLAGALEYINTWFDSIFVEGNRIETFDSFWNSRRIRSWISHHFLCFVARFFIIFGDQLGWAGERGARIGSLLSLIKHKLDVVTYFLSLGSKCRNPTESYSWRHTKQKGNALPNSVRRWGSADGRETRSFYVITLQFRVSAPVALHTQETAWRKRFPVPARLKSLYWLCKYCTLNPLKAATVGTRWLLFRHTGANVPPHSMPSCCRYPWTMIRSIYLDLVCAADVGTITALFSSLMLPNIMTVLLHDCFPSVCTHKEIDFFF